MPPFEPKRDRSFKYRGPAELFSGELMIPLISAGFGEPIPENFQAKLRHVAHGPRADIAVNDHHEPIDLIVRNVKSFCDTSAFVIGGWSWRGDDGRIYQKRNENLAPMKDHLANQCRSTLAAWRQHGGRDRDCIIEIGNELDGSYWKNNLDEFFETAMTCYNAIRQMSKETPIITGSTMNFNKEPLWKKGGYEILDELCDLKWPKDTWQGLHPYRGGGREFPSFDSIEKALAELKKVLRGRPVAITEMGWASRTGHSNEKIAEMMRLEIEMWHLFGAMLFCFYQIQDAPIPENKGEGGFGAYTNAEEGLTAKPVVEPLHNYLEFIAS